MNPDNARLADELEKHVVELDKPGLDIFIAAQGPAVSWFLRNRHAILSALRQQARAVPDGLKKLRSDVFAVLRRHEVSEQCFAEVAMITHAALSTQPDDEFIHRAPTSVDPSLEGPGVPDDVMAMIERLRAPDYWLSGSEQGHEYMNGAPFEASTMLETLHAEIGRAVAVEREECAKVAEGWVTKNFAWSTIRRSTGDYIATAIRARATLAGEGE